MKNNKKLFLMALYFFSSLSSTIINIENGLISPIKIAGYEYIAEPGDNIMFNINDNTKQIIEDFIYVIDHDIVIKSLCIFNKELGKNIILDNKILNLRLVIKDHNDLELIILNPIVSIKNQT